MSPLDLLRRKPVVVGIVALTVVGVAVVAGVVVEAFRPDDDERHIRAATVTGTTSAGLPSESQPSASNPPTAGPTPTAEGSPTATGKPVPPSVFSDRPRTNDSKTPAQLVGVDAGRGKGVETVTFSFAGGEVLPTYRVAYSDTVRLHPDEDPIPVDGNVYLIVSFELTDPNQANRLAFPPSIQVGQPQVAEVLLYDNLSGSLKFAVGLESKTRFRIVTPDDPTRLVIEIQT